MIHQKFGSFGGLKLHYREVHRAEGGRAGVPLVLLHPSPKSSAMFAPLMAMFPPSQHVIALDTPGYGLSEPLAAPAQAIADYLPALHSFFQQVAGPRFKLYGSATGAQLALGYANTYPADVAHLLLDNAAHFCDAERDAILARYFIDITPAADGSHLPKLWQMCRQSLQYFPWYEKNPAHQFRATEPTAAEVQAAMNEYLLVGPRYVEAYMAAFKHERVEHYQLLSVPTTLFRWQGSLLLKEIDDLLRHPLPACIRVVDVPAPMNERYAAIVAAGLK
ncbi:MAG: alpha/beta fold hydrolase [Aeromicrobium sp.]|nr:alpha/beta fold hydrolase [Burkholderiales bacterium]